MSEQVAQNGDTVSVHYVGRFPGGKVFDTSMKAEAEKAGLFSPARDYKPLQVVLGAHQVIPGFEEALNYAAVQAALIRSAHTGAWEDVVPLRQGVSAP